MEFTVNGIKWLLRFVKPSSTHLRRSDGTYTLGVTDWNDKTVYIAYYLSDYMTDKVFAHELTHVFSFSYDYRMDIETEEIVADFLSLFGRNIVYMADSILCAILNCGIVA